MERSRLFDFGVAILAVGLLAGCSIKQTVDSATLNPDLAPEICMISGPGVRSGFTNAYQAALQNKGFGVQPLPVGTNPSQCPLATTYTANWAWDLAMYMHYADIRVFEHGRQVGHAVYDARSGGGRPDKFIDAEAKLNELVDQLFPHGTAGLGRVAAANTEDAQRKPSIQEQLNELAKSGVSYEEYQRRYREIMAQSR
jgi:hypothetical protein